jgi:hypothetical protein
MSPAQSPLFSSSARSANEDALMGFGVDVDSSVGVWSHDLIVHGGGYETRPIANLILFDVGVLLLS